MVLKLKLHHFTGIELLHFNWLLFVGILEYGLIDLLRLLSDHGADIIGQGSSEYESAKEFASENSHMAACRFLESRSV